MTLRTNLGSAGRYPCPKMYRSHSYKSLKRGTAVVVEVLDCLLWYLHWWSFLEKVAAVINRVACLSYAVMTRS